MDIAMLHLRNHPAATQIDLGHGAVLELQGSLLQLRGDGPSSSPLRDEAGNLLVFNG